MCSETAIAGALSALLAAFSLRRNLTTLFNPPPSNFTSIDGLRAISILLVIAFHVVWLRGEYVGPAAWTAIVSDPALSILLRGDLGVDVFFVISGFLIAHLLITEYRTRGTISIRQFYVKRAVRLLPAYFFVLTIVWVLKILDGQACETLWANVLFINNFVSAERQCMPWSWSLAVEVHFYIAFPFALLLLYRLQRSQLTCLFLILLVGVAVRGVTNLQNNQHIPIVAEPWVDLDQYIEAFNVYDKTYTRFGALVCGVIAAYLYHNNGAVDYLERSRVEAFTGFLLAAMCMMVIVVPLVRAPDTHWMPIAEFLYLALDRYIFSAAIAYLLLLSLCMHGPGRIIGTLLSSRIWYPIAQLSYSTYLVHVIVVTVCYRYFLNPMNLSYAAFLGDLLITIVLSLLAALVVYVSIERPMMSLRSRASDPSPVRATSMTSNRGLRAGLEGPPPIR